MQPVRHAIQPHGNLGRPQLSTASANCNYADASLKRQVTYTWDDFGNKLATADALNRTWTYRYDLYGNLTSRQSPEQAKVSAATQTTYSYTLNGLLQSRSVPGTGNTGQQLTYTRNALGQVTRAETRDGNAALIVAYDYSYDIAHRLAGIADSRGNKRLNYQWTPGGRLARVQLLDNTTPTHAWDFKYDAVGRLSALVAPNGQTTTLSLDAGGRLLERVLASGAAGAALTSAYTWHPEGSLATVSHQSAATVLARHDYGYDVWGHRASATETLGGAGGVGGITARTTSYSYDALDRLKQTSTPAAIASLSAATPTSPNAVFATNQWLEIDLPAAQPLSAVLLKTSTNPAPPATGLTPQIQAAVMTIQMLLLGDDAPALAAASAPASASALTSAPISTLLPTPASKPPQTQAQAQAATYSVTYWNSISWVPVSNLAAHAVGNDLQLDFSSITTTKLRVQFNGLQISDIATWDSTSPGSQSNSYDIFGNRLSQTASLPLASTSNYSHDAAHQLTQVQQTTGTNITTSALLLYDDNGNLKKLCEGSAVSGTAGDCSASQTTAFTWDGLDQLASLLKAGSAALNEAYAYDDAGRRIKKTSGSATTHYLYDGPDRV